MAADMVLKINITLACPEGLQKYNDNFVKRQLQGLLEGKELDIPHPEIAGEMIGAEVTSVTTTRTS